MKLLLAAFFSLVCLITFGQTEISEFGAFQPDEISYKECPFDKEADAVVFFDKALSNYDDQWNLVTSRRIRFKILKAKGIERANVHVYFYSGDDFETIRDIDAVILSYDDQKNQVTENLDKKAIFIKKLNAYYSELSFTLPNVKVGSIIEYKYESVKNNYGGLKEWIFQKDMPVLLSTYELYIIPNHEFAYQVHKSPGLDIDIKPENDRGKVTFAMQNIPGLRDEAYMASANDYLQKVVFQLSGFTNHIGKTKVNTTWSDLAKDLLETRDFGTQMYKDISDAKGLVEEAQKKGGDFEKMKFIHNYVRSAFTWDHIYSLYSTDGVKHVWDAKKGNAGDLNLLLINLLKAAGLQTFPLLVSERDHGKVNADYPFIGQFDKVMAYVLIDGKSYILDATDQGTPSSMIPYDCLNTKGFIVDRKKADFIDIKDPQHQMRRSINILANVDDKGNVTGQAAIYSFDYDRIAKEEKYKKDKDKYWHAYLSSYQGISIDSFQISGTEADTLPLSENFNLATHLNKSGDYYMLSYNLFTGYSKNEFVTQNRFSNIDFGCMHTCDLNGNFYLPENMTIESLPKSVTLRTPDNSLVFTRSVQKTDKLVNIAFRIQVLRTEFTPDEYELVQGFFKQLYDLVNEPVLLKAK